MREEKRFEVQPWRSERGLFRLFPAGNGLLGIFLAGVLFVLVGGLVGNVTAQTPPVPEVEVVTVTQKDVPVYSEWVGTTEGLVNAKIRAQVTGYLSRQAYKEGASVKKGDLLFEIDPRTFKAALDQAEAQLAIARARLGKTELDVKRYRPLAKESAISQEELDDAVQANLAAKAGVQAAEATVEQAKLNLSFTKITSPVDGIAGSANAQVGDLVGPTQTGDLTTVSTVDPIKVYFPISEQEYMALARDLAKTGAKADIERPKLDLILADGSVYPYKGEFSFAERQVDVKTGTIRIAALFPNPGDILRPGQFGRVRAVTDTKKGAIMVPQRAVMELQGSYQVAVVGPENKVSIRSVKAGERVDSLWVITSGLQPGERVIVEGLQKVKEGMLVNPKSVEAESTPQSVSSPKPEAKPVPTPAPKKD
ncbi:efflux RND transporter periplasmic adaptor subunit [Desulforhabdus amnigena]|jgi:membrane fusion protein (multidrug efflux system)|uniref:MexE family multidrug efflux RND transporter periplasmic adaptor subunit n=1 Tax=Desulforhabdus amnigena TaxID=40218 RepID=A0A9W6D5L8_9BACT|nr:efflux RND transporter periplasmic adaptor subunit [Desulforhabdus amnigena]GLI33761.1 MexE family multidrug efflux RND transporter periplasmic adaptor subunit [Desulforhabdus amnigena]